MANKLIKTQELFGEEISIITKNPSEWLKFLDTCSNNYKFSFTEQVLATQAEQVNGKANNIDNISDFGKLLLKDTEMINFADEKKFKAM